MCVHLMKRARACGLSGSKLAVLVALAYRGNPDNDNCCWPSIETLAVDCGFGVRTVQARLKELIEDGHITRIYVKGRSSIFRVHPRNASASAESQGAGVQNPHPTPAIRAVNPRKICGETERNQNIIKKRKGKALAIGEVLRRLEIARAEPMIDEDAFRHEEFYASGQ